MLSKTPYWLSLSLFVTVGALASSCGDSEACDDAVALCMANCPANSVLQSECVSSFEVSTESACEAALLSFVCPAPAME